MAGSSKGTIFDIQRFSIHDGPGIRTLVFFKGCPLSCAWCSNPESQSSLPELMLDHERCRLCGRCTSACPIGCHAIVAGPQGRTHEVNRQKCQGHGKCVQNCPTSALRLVGARMTVDEVLAAVLEDYLFFVESRGGVTLGGGEPTTQPAFALELLRKCREYGIHTALETCGHTDRRVLERLMPFVDLFLFDIKHVDPQKHRSATGAPNDRILANAAHLLRTHASVVVRIPLIPGFNDDRESLEEMLGFVGEHSRSRSNQRVDLLPYHRFGVGKYRRLGREYPMDKNAALQANIFDHAQDVARSLGLALGVQGFYI
ncbi:MAG: glycyl-radical enzyme activating protein [Deltaproteobacteria bacterium]|nr:glycyl-radical enzyme activating protein [Deltaproteobacteria bacterium]